jgi:hypothetical protein
MIVIATISAALIGFFFEARLRTAFASPLTAASFLVLNGIILLRPDRDRQAGERPAGGDDRGFHRPLPRPKRTARACEHASPVRAEDRRRAGESHPPAQPSYRLGRVG